MNWLRLFKPKPVASPAPDLRCDCSHGTIPQEWMTRRMTVPEVEAERMHSDPRLGDVPVPFGFQNHKWQLMLKQMQDGDELWEYISKTNWSQRSGVMGIALVRSGTVIACVHTLVS